MHFLAHRFAVLDYSLSAKAHLWNSAKYSQRKLAAKTLRDVILAAVLASLSIVAHNIGSFVLLALIFISRYRRSPATALTTGFIALPF
jgi:hypothetical protein